MHMHRSISKTSNYYHHNSNRLAKHLTLFIITRIFSSPTPLIIVLLFILTIIALLLVIFEPSPVLPLSHEHPRGLGPPSPSELAVSAAGTVGLGNERRILKMHFLISVDSF